MKYLFKIVFAFLILFISVYFCAIIFEPYLTEAKVNALVKKKETLVNIDRDTLFLIHTEKEIFINKNNYYHGKNNSSRLIKKIKKGQRYSFKVVGYKIGFDLPFFSRYRNIVEVIENEKKTNLRNDY
ncbi:MAG: hypothetical protein K9J16_09160 [Melioribacteraceae bacterium]|nr:hypothetical protein [Melioribacteraceae bacterium]MCF8353225.1 hypothetical protein [Melioribacteraceae bacterium]MCF8393957.1 hypothetical protein [Melioribacteraceae bacterium]MCF8418741.1 hypothetical protein [Melioribacteraceae bacterium]